MTLELFKYLVENLHGAPDVKVQIHEGEIVIDHGVRVSTIFADGSSSEATKKEEC